MDESEFNKKFPPDDKEFRGRLGISGITHFIEISGHTRELDRLASGWYA